MCTIYLFKFFKCYAIKETWKVYEKSRAKDENLKGLKIDFLLKPFKFFTWLSQTNHFRYEFHKLKEFCKWTPQMLLVCIVLSKLFFFVLSTHNLCKSVKSASSVFPFFSYFGRMWGFIKGEMLLPLFIL